MPVSAKLYGNAIIKLGNKEIDWVTDTMAVSLHTSTYAPNQDTHDYQNDLTNEVADDGAVYRTGGTELGNRTLTYATATNVVKFDADDVSWAASTITARYAVVYGSAGTTTSANPLFCYVDFGSDQISSGGAFTITWGTAGIATVTVA
jgi:hypothetical protein